MSLRSDAEKLGQSKYAPVLEALRQQGLANLAMYNTGTKERTTALNREVGSIQAAEATSTRQIADLKTGAANSYQQAIAQSQQNSAATQIARNQANSNMLSSLEAEARARGLSSGTGGGYAEFATRLGSQDATMNAVATMNRGALERGGQHAQDILNQQIGMSKMSSTTSQSTARGLGQQTLDELYKTYLTQKQALGAEEASKTLEKGDYINQTYMVLKEKAEQKAAQKAQAKAASAIAAGNLNYKYEALKVGTQYKYDKLASDTAQKDITNKLKAEGFSHKRAMDIADLAIRKGKFNLDVEKFDWSKANPTSSNQKIADIIASIQ